MVPGTARRLVHHPLDILLLAVAIGAIIAGVLLVARVFANERTLGVVFLVGGILTIYNAVRVAAKSRPDHFSS
jgi:ABC-type enterochelin transport system permease subunit